MHGNWKRMLDGGYKVPFEETVQFILDCENSMVSIVGYEGFWIYDNGAVQPVGELLGVIEEAEDSEKFISMMLAAMKVPLPKYEAVKFSTPARLEVEFTVQ